MRCLFSLVVALMAASTSAKIVDTLYGQVDGNTVTLDDGKVVNSWYGIPYARPPVGDLRFALPIVAAPWDGVLETKALPQSCVQDPAGLLWMTHPGWNNYGEDCLNLNVFAPEDLSGAPLAVMVWFHGGAYTGGGNIQYPGHFLAQRDVVVVVPNYRLDSFGFLATPDGTIRGNMGLYDQALALRWVRDNIRNFGGNPNRVTIFGQSAGAGSSSLHMVSPFSQGLYHQAIMESGTEGNLWTLNYPAQKPEEYVYQVAAKLNCTQSTDPEIVACLRSATPLALRLAQRIDCTPGYFCQGFAPIVDGPGGFIPKIPLEIREEMPASQYVPIISGICRDDGSLYTQAYMPEANDGGFTSDQFNEYLRTRVIDMWGAQLTAEQYEQVFDVFRWYYINWPYLEDLDANREAFNMMITDGAFGYPWDRQLKMNSERNPNTYAYVQSYISPNASTFIPPWMGVPHMGELPYVWGYGKLLNNQAVRDDSGIQFDIVGWTQEDADYADFQITLWTNFAKYGNPTPQPVKAPFSDDLITWEKFSWDDNLKVLDLDRTVITQENFRQQRNAFYYDYLSSLLDRPFMSGSEAGPKPANPASQFRFSSQIVEDAIKRMVREKLDEWGIKAPETD